jgi:hypothetical protein
MIRDVGFLAKIILTARKTLGSLTNLDFQRIQASAAAPAHFDRKAAFLVTHVRNRNAPGSHSEHD